LGGAKDRTSGESLGLTPYAEGIAEAIPLCVRMDTKLRRGPDRALHVVKHRKTTDDPV
jgi:hypothetical protein